MKEMEVGAGERVDRAIARLVAQAPAFCVFNGAKLEAHKGATEDDVWAQWTAEMARREGALPRCPTCGKPR